jgi:hypothetical protein
VVGRAAASELSSEAAASGLRLEAAAIVPRLEAAAIVLELEAAVTEAAAARAGVVADVGGESSGG